MAPHQRSHGKEYRVKIEREGQPPEYSDWFNTFEALQNEMQRTRRAEGAIYTAQQRDFLCQDCARKEAEIEDISPL